MKWHFYLFVFCFACVCSCTQAVEGDMGSSHTSSILDTNTNELITQLGDLIYDFPDTFLIHDDSIVHIINGINDKQVAEPKSLQLLHLNVGYVYRQNGRILKAINAYEKAIELYFKQPDTSLNFTEYFVKPLGSLYTMTGDLQKASDLQLLDLNNPNTNAENKASLYANLAITIKQQELYDSAIHICKIGLLHTSSNSTTALRLNNELAANYIALLLYDSAEVYNNLSQHLIANNTTTHEKESIIWLSTTKSNSAKLAQYKRNNRLAYRYIEEALALLEDNFTNSHQREKAKLYLTKANILKELGNNKAAVESYHRALQLINPDGLPYFADNTVTDCYSGLAFCSSNDSMALAYFQKAIENDYIVQQFIKTKESNYLNSSQSRSMLQSASDLLFKQYQNDNLERHGIAMTMLWLTELFKGRQLLNEQSRAANWKLNDTLSLQIKTVQNQLRFLYESLAKATTSEKKKKIQEEIRTIIYKSSLSENVYDKQYQSPNREAFYKELIAVSNTKDILSWQINDNGNSYVISIQNGVGAIQLLTHKDSVQKNTALFYQNYFANGPALFNNNPQRYFEASGQILQQIIPGVGSCRQDQWLLSRDGFIYGLPIEALTINDQFVLQQKMIKSVYTLFQYSDEPYIVDKKMDVSIFAKKSHEAPFHNLEYIDNEIEAISNTVSTRVYMDKATSFDEFQQALNSSSILHVSTHAIADKTHQPYIVLDEKIDLDKLEFSLTQSPLVVLSACETANGLSINGEGLESINKAFLSKGVKGVIAAQWNVNDAFVPAFMHSFYTNLILTKSPDLALRASQIDYIQSKSSNKMANPWEWASLGYTGDSIQLSMVASNERSVNWWWLIGIGPLCGVAFYYYRKANLNKASTR